MFSFTLFERGEGSNLLRVQTDNFDQPFDLNEGARLDLGSTAKLRTLVTYLELVADLHRRWHAMPAEELAALQLSRRDPLSRWARDHLAQSQDRSLAAMLDAAMERTYSANPAEGFFTGGGLHRFDNFDRDDDRRTMSVREALTRSVNLVFIRLMRDVVHHVMARSEGESAALIDDESDPRRQDYLARFADKEGRQFVARFHRQFAGKTAQDAEDLLLRSARPSPTRLAAAFYALRARSGPARAGGLHPGAAAERRAEPGRAGGAARQVRAGPLVAGRPRLPRRRAPAGPVGGRAPARASRGHAGRGARGQRHAAAGGLRVVVQDAPEGRPGRTHPRPARSRGLCRDPQVVAAPGLPVRDADALVRECARRLGRPAGGAGRTDGHHRQPGHRAADDAGVGTAVRARHAVRDASGLSTHGSRPSVCSSPRWPTPCGAR